VDVTNAPLLPNCFRQLSRSLWSSINSDYQYYPDVAEAAGRFPDWKVKGPVTRQFMNPRDDFVLYRDEMCKPGNKAVMRKGGGAMKKSPAA